MSIEHVADEAMVDDAALANTVAWHDKHVLARLLGQPSLAIAPGAYWIKPAVSEEGLGHCAQRVHVAAESVLVPEATGRYLNVDYNGSEFHVWDASRDGVEFHWFRYVGEGHRHLTPSQLGAVVKLWHYCSQPWLNLEFIGDTVIEAHARPSSELWPLITKHATSARDVYCLPTWGQPAEAFGDVVHLGPESPVNGRQRTALLYCDHEGFLGFRDSVRGGQNATTNSNT